MAADLKIQVGADVQSAVAGLKQVSAGFEATGLSMDQAVKKLDVFYTAINRTADPKLIKAYEASIAKLEGRIGELKDEELKAAAASREMAAAQVQSAEASKVATGGLGSFLNTNAKARIAFVDLGRVITDQGFSLRSIASNFTLFNPLVVVAAAGIGYFVKSLIDAKEHITTNTDIIKESGKEYQNAVTEVDSLRNNIDLAKRGFLDKNKVVEQYNDTLGKTTGFVKNLDQAEAALNKNASAYIQFTLLKAAANLALDKAAAQAFEAEKARQQKASDFQSIKSNASVFGQGQVSAPGFIPGTDPTAALKAQEIAAEKVRQKAISEAEKQKQSLEDIAKKFNDDAAKISKDFHFNFFQDNKENKVDTSKASDKALKDLADFIRKTDEILKSPREKELEELQARYTKVKDELIKQGLSTASLNVANQQAILDINAKYDAKIAEQDLKFAEEYADALVKEYQQRQKDLEASSKLLIDINKETYSEQELKLSESLAKGLITLKQFNQKAEQLKIEGLQGILSSGILTKKDQEAIQVQLNNALTALNKFKSAAENISDTINKEISNAVVGLAQTLGDLFSGTKNPFASFLNVISQGLTEIGKQMIVASPIIASLKVALKSLNPAILLPAGIALVAVGSALKANISKSATAFADGGIVTGPTNALIGEAGPEVVFPLNKLNNFIKGISNSGQQLQFEPVNWTLRGADIHGSLRATNKRVNRGING